MAPRTGILFKTAAALEGTGRIGTVVLDKTGTVTEGAPKVTDIIPFGAMDETGLLSAAAALEGKSEHPLAKAILREAEEMKIARGDVSGFEAVPGHGLKGVIDGKSIIGGNLSFAAENAAVGDDVKAAADSLSQEGQNTDVLCARREVYRSYSRRRYDKARQPRCRCRT